MTRIAKGKQSGELWDRVVLENGLVGYVFQNYVEEVKDIPVQEINLSLENNVLQKGETAVLNVEITPDNATNKELTYSSSNPEVVSIDTTGKLFAVSSGKATITAKSKNNISSSIDVTVYSKVTGLQLKEQDLYLQVGESYTVNPIVLPEDANNKNTKFSSSENSVATIDEKGNIKAIAQGTTQIKVITEENNYEKEITVTVIPELAITFDSPIEVNGNQVSGIDERTTVNSLREKIATSYKLEFVNKSGEILNDDQFVGTESKIRVYDGEKLIIEYKIIIYGDLNGDGKINSIDLLVLQRHILELKQLDGLYLKAGNINKDGKAPSSIDLLKIQRHILNLKKIEQTTNKVSTISKNNIQYAEQSQIQLSLDKANVKAGDNVEVTVNSKNLKVSAYDFRIYFDTNKVELVSEADNINVNNNTVICTGFDENGGQNINKNAELVKLNFKAKEDGVNIFSLQGNFYNEKEELTNPIVKLVEIDIGETNEENNIVESSDKNNANLAILRLEEPGIVPDFNPNIKEYYLTVSENITNLDVTATAQNRNSKVTITGNKNLVNGMNEVLVKVVSENEKERSDYKIYVTKTNDVEMANAQLETLAIENVTLEPDFFANITNYKATVDNNIKSLNIFAIPQNENANVEIDGTKNLKDGNNIVTVTVYAPNQITFRKYKINVYKRSIEEQQENDEANKSEPNIEQVSLIDNSKEIIEAEQETSQRESKNSLYILIGTIVAIVIVGVVIIMSRRK